MALQIASALKAELSPDERTRIRRKPTSDVQAYQLYLQGRHCYSRYTEEGIRKGIEYFRQAIAVDPGYALAYTGVALAYAEFAAGQGGGGMREDVAYQPAKEAITKALALDSELGEAHSVLALLKCVHDFDWAGAEEEFKLALELSPGSADIYDHYGWLCSALERYDEALALVKRAQELDPLTHRADVATELLRAGRYEEAFGVGVALHRVRAWLCEGTLYAGMGLPEERHDGRGAGPVGTVGSTLPREYPLPGPTGASLRDGRQDRPGSGGAATTGRTVAAEIRLALPHGVCLHRPR